MASNGNLTARQRRFITFLLVEKDVKSAADKAGIGERTAYRWMKNPGVKSAILEAEGAALQTVTRALIRLASQAVETLEGAMADGDARQSAKIRAADIILGRLLSLRELSDIEQRITALEVAQNEG